MAVEVVHDMASRLQNEFKSQAAIFHHMLQPNFVSIVKATQIFERGFNMGKFSCGNSANEKRPSKQSHHLIWDKLGESEGQSSGIAPCYARLGSVTLGLV